jgi:hypothetical protein
VSVASRRAACFVVTLLLALPALPATAADEPRVFAPSSAWAVQSDGESCVISRQFGGSDGLTFGLQAFAPGATSYNAILRGDPLPQRGSGALELEYRFNPDTGAIPLSGVLSAGGDKPRLSFGATLDRASVIQAMRDGEEALRGPDEAREAEVDGLFVSFSRGRPLLVQLGPMAGPLARLRECIASLPATWGLDPAVQQSLTRRPLPIEVDKWLGPGSYPWEYLRTYLSVDVQIRLMTDAAGTATQCVVQSPRNSLAGPVACREIMKTARFEPALDAAGNAVASYYTTRIAYRTRRRNSVGGW